MHSTANTPYIGTVDGAPPGGIYRSRSQLTLDSYLLYPETVSLRGSGECLWGYYYSNIFCGLLPSLTEGVSDRREVKDEI